MTTTDQQRGAIAVHTLAPADSDDARLVDQPTGLINDVYSTAESGLSRDGAARTTASELAELIRAEQIAVATPCDLAVYEKPLQPSERPP